LKKLTQILRLWHTANFWAETNKDGKMLDFGGRQSLTFVPCPSLALRLNALNASLLTSSQGLQILLPVAFENNLVNASYTAHLPENLYFYVLANDALLLQYTGLDFGTKKLYAAASNTNAAYSQGLMQISAKILGKSAAVTDQDLCQVLSNYSLSGIEKLFAAKASTTQSTIDLKANLLAKDYNLAIATEYQAFVKVLLQNQFRKVTLSLHRQSNNTLLKTIIDLLILPETQPNACIGIVAIPKAALLLNENNQANYQNINHFMLHLPTAKIKLELSLSTNAFENGSKLLLDGLELNATSGNHPSLAGYKILTHTINNYNLYHQAAKRLCIQKANSKIIIDINPINTLNMSTKTSKISLIKTI
jgi:hypothetical protein